MELIFCYIFSQCWFFCDIKMAFKQIINFYIIEIFFFKLYNVINILT